MSREEDSGASGPQTASRTTFSDSTRVQNFIPVPSKSDSKIIEEDSHRLRRDALEAELRGRGNVEADENMPWKIDEMRPSLGFGDPPTSLVVSTAGSLKGNFGSDNVHDDAPNGFEDAPDSPNDVADGSNVASFGSNDVLDCFKDAENGSNVISDEFSDPFTTSSRALEVSSALGGANMEESVIVVENRPTSLPEDTDILMTSFSGP